MHNIEYIVRVGCRTYYERLSPRFLWTFLFFIFLGVFTHAPPGVIYVTTPFLLPSFYFSLYLIKYYTATRILCFPRATTVAQWYYILYRYNHNYKDTAATLKKIYTIYIYIGASVLMILLVLYYYYYYLLLLLLLTYIGSGCGGVKNNGTVKRKYIYV